MTAPIDDAGFRGMRDTLAEFAGNVTATADRPFVVGLTGPGGKIKRRPGARGDPGRRTFLHAGFALKAMLRAPSTRPRASPKH